MASLWYHLKHKKIKNNIQDVCVCVHVCVCVCVTGKSGTELNWISTCKNPESVTHICTQNISALLQIHTEGFPPRDNL